MEFTFITQHNMSTKFKLHVDPVQVDKDFKIMDKMEKTIEKQDTFNPMVTRLEDLGIDEKQVIVEPDVSIPSSHFYLFYSLKDFTESKSLPTVSPYPCFHCTEPFMTPPLGIPMDYISSYYESTSFSEKDGSTVFYRKDICSKRDMEQAKKNKLTIVHRDYFRVDGNFCSFPCMIAYIQHHPSSRYSNVGYLLKHMHVLLYKKPLEWIAAPDIRLLKKYGGHLTVAEFRSADGRKYIRSLNYHHVTFSDTDVLPLCVPSSLAFQYIGDKLT